MFLPLTLLLIPTMFSSCVTTAVWVSKMYDLKTKSHTAAEIEIMFVSQQKVKFSPDSIFTCSEILQES